MSFQQRYSIIIVVQQLFWCYCKITLYQSVNGKQFVVVVVVFISIYLIFTGNQTSNKNIKESRKKMKKANKRSEKKVNAVADVLENFSLDMCGGGQDYEFDNHFE